MRFFALLPVLSLATGWSQQPPLAPPVPSITAAQQFQYYLDRTYGWQTLSWLASDTALDHFRTRPQWGRGPDGYGCEYASNLGRRMVSNSAELGAALALRADTRFHASGRTGFLPRLRYATAHAFLETGAGAKFEPAYARFAGIAADAWVAPAWQRQSLSAPGFFQDVTFGMLGQLQNSVLNEFSPDLQKLGRNVRKHLLRK